MADHMTYHAARDRIKDGDLVMVWHPPGWHGFQTFLHVPMDFFTGSPIYHTVVALWMTTSTGVQRLMCVEQHPYGGKRLAPLSIYEHQKLEVFHLPENASYIKMEDEVMRKVSDQFYAFHQLLFIGIKDFFGGIIRLGGSQVCSQLSSACWIAAGVPLETTLVSPGGLRSAVTKLGIEPSIVIDVT
jgi:hypothetical protein